MTQAIHPEPFRKQSAGRSCIVLGVGASALRAYLDDVPLESYHLIGTNDAGALASLDHLLIMDQPQAFAPDRVKAIEASKCGHAWLAVHSDWSHRVKSSWSNFRPKRIYPPRWKMETLGLCLPTSNNTPFVATNLALYLGFTTIGLLGVDFRGHPILSGTEGLARAERDFADIVQVCSNEGAKLINLSEDSLLTSVPRGTLAELEKRQ